MDKDETPCDTYKPTSGAVVDTLCMTCGHLREAHEEERLVREVIDTYGVPEGK